MKLSGENLVAQFWMQKMENRKIFQLTTCRECHGAVSLEGDPHGVYVQSGQCGFLCDLVEASVAVIKPQKSHLTDSVEENPASLPLRLCRELIGLEGDCPESFRRVAQFVHSLRLDFRLL